jgi:hypothetical protein
MSIRFGLLSVRGLYRAGPLITGARELDVDVKIILKMYSTDWCNCKSLDWCK